jgi:hypothetical protein
VGTPTGGLAQEEDREYGVDQQNIFDRVALFLAAITARLLSRILGTPDTPFGAIMPTRGEAGAVLVPLWRYAASSLLGGEMEGALMRGNKNPCPLT